MTKARKTKRRKKGRKATSICPPYEVLRARQAKAQRILYDNSTDLRKGGGTPSPLGGWPQ